MPLLQPKPHQKSWENWQASLSSTCKLYKILSLYYSRTLRTLLPNAHTTGCILYKVQYKFYKESPIGWESYSLYFDEKDGHVTDYSKL